MDKSIKVFGSSGRVTYFDAESRKSIHVDVVCAEYRRITWGCRERTELRHAEAFVGFGDEVQARFEFWRERAEDHATDPLP